MSYLTLGARRSIRPFSTTAPKYFLSNIFGNREAKKKEIIEKQDDYEIDPNSKIVILNEENSPSFKPFNAEEDMPDFQVSQWKFRNVKAQDIEATFQKEELSKVIQEAYQELKGESPNDFAAVSLADLPFRFQFCKLLQQKLGFDIKDHTITRTHNLDMLFQELNKVVAHRWSSERNPNGIVLRPEDFQQFGNVYLSSELSEEEQKKTYEELLEKAREANGL